MKTSGQSEDISDSTHRQSTPEKLCFDELMDKSNPIEQRRSRRVRMKQTLRVRPSDPKDGSFEELGTTANLSQGGLYFVTQRTVYYEGMLLIVAVPYDATTPSGNYEYHGKVMRVDDLGNGQKGVAIRFVSTGAKKPAKL